MAKTKSQGATWYCTECRAGNYHSSYDKRRNEEIVKELEKFCRHCRKHLSHKRKDTKKAVAK